MCLQCDDPTTSFGDYLEQVVLPLVHRHGWAVQGVRGRTPLAHTVGLTECGLPELVVTGLPESAGAALLNAAVARALRDEVRPGQVLRLPAAPVLAVIEVEQAAERLPVATALYLDAVRALQLVWPDGCGRYPWEPSAEQGQLLLGTHR